MITKAMNKLPTAALWYVSCVGAAVYLRIATESWLPAFVIGALFLIGSLIHVTEFTQGVSKASKMHHDAIMEEVAKTREMLAEYSERLA